MVKTLKINYLCYNAFLTRTKSKKKHHIDFSGMIYYSPTRCSSRRIQNESSIYPQNRPGDLFIRPIYDQPFKNLFCTNSDF